MLRDTNHLTKPNPLRAKPAEFLWEVAGGFAGLALFDLLSRDGFFSSALQASPSTKSLDLSNPLTPRQPHFPAKAKRVVFLFMNGAPSQVDTFDPKPALSRFHGTPYKGDVEQVGSNGRPVGHIMQSPFEFQRHGQSGLEISSLRTAGCRRSVCDPVVYTIQRRMPQRLQRIRAAC
jgi:hypothetical protein